MMKNQTIWVVASLLISFGCGDDDTLPVVDAGGSDAGGSDVGGADAGDMNDVGAEPTCRDGVQNGDEEGIDCGGVCRACDVPATCEDGLQNGDEEGVDCGGMCPACGPAPTCDDGMRNGGEAGVDCGGPCPTVCPSCSDGLMNGTETGVDCGGRCPRCSMPAPAGWTCGDDSYDDERCDCGCAVRDLDCASGASNICIRDACGPNEVLVPDDNSMCGPFPETPGNPSFETTPGAAGDIPEWTILRQDGISDVFVVGPAQTMAPDGSRALYLTSTYRFNGGMFGFPSPVEVASSEFIPPAGACMLTISLGDTSEVGANADFGTITVRAMGAPSPLDILAQVDIGTRTGNVRPTEDTYQDIEMAFTHDGTLRLRVEVLADAGFNTKSFHVDNLRVTCD